MKITSAKTLKLIARKVVLSSGKVRLRNGLAESKPKTKELMASSNDSASSSTNEYETFADEVQEVIPEVDHRGRIQGTESHPAEVHDEIVRRSLSQVDSSTMRLDRSITFWKSILSTKTPYDEFHHLFKTVPKDQFPINNFSCALSREILLQGRLYISQGWFCFYSNIFGWETQVTIDCSKIVSITREKTAYVVPNAILICTEEEKHFFSSFLSRETVYKLLLQVWEEASPKAKVSVSENESSDKVHDEAELQEDVKLEQDEDLEDEESNGDADTNQNCQEEDDNVCLQCQDNRKSFIVSNSRQHLNEMVEPDQILTRQSSRDSVSRGRKAVKDKGSAKLGMFARLVVMLASLAEMLYSYVQVSIKLIKRLSSEQLFILVASFLIGILTLSSCYLFYRITVLEPRILGTTISSEESVHESVKQILKLRQDIFNAEVTSCLVYRNNSASVTAANESKTGAKPEVTRRFKTIIAANLEAITQVRENLRVLQENLKLKFKKNCSLTDDELCEPLTI